MVSRRRWEAALYHQTGPHPPGKRGPKPLKGKRQRRLQAWAERADTPWETVAVDWYGGHRKQLWVFSRTALWHPRGLPPVDIRFVLVGDPEGKLRMEAFFCTDLQATPVQILEWVVMRWEEPSGSISARNASLLAVNSVIGRCSATTKARKSSRLNTRR